jgi:hypothetical protein
MFPKNYFLAGFIVGGGKKVLKWFKGLAKGKLRLLYERGVFHSVGAII